MPTLVVAGRYGRLANRLWTYANVLAFAREWSFKVVNPAFGPFSHFFALGDWNNRSFDNNSGNLVIRRGRFPEMVANLYYKINLKTKFYPTLELGEGGRFSLEKNKEFVDFVKRESIIFLSGFYFESPNNLEKHGSEIRKILSPNLQISGDLYRKISSIRNDTDTLIGVHMRQGDYRTFCDGIMYYSTDEYRNIMRCLDSQTKGRTRFIICSDEIQCRDEFPGLDVIISHGSAVEDIYTLAHCDFLIGPNSSFSQWASWWGNVPLHILDWRTAITYGAAEPIFEPQLSMHFSPFDAHDFSKYSDSEIKFEQFL